MSKNKIIGWIFIAIGVHWFIIGIKGVIIQNDCIKNMSQDMPVCGVLPPEISGGIFSVIPLAIGVLFLRKKHKKVK